MSRNLFYNPKYRTKQIFELNCEPDTQPGENEVFYWLSTANDKLYANYQMNGRSTLTFEISDPEKRSTDRHVSQISKQHEKPHAIHRNTCWTTGLFRMPGTWKIVVSAMA